MQKEANYFVTKWSQHEAQREYHSGLMFTYWQTCQVSHHMHGDTHVHSENHWTCCEGTTGTGFCRMFATRPAWNCYDRAILLWSQAIVGERVQRASPTLIVQMEICDYIYLCLDSGFNGLCPEASRPYVSTPKEHVRGYRTSIARHLAGS